jgi:hypothetical protein
MGIYIGSPFPYNDVEKLLRIFLCVCEEDRMKKWSIIAMAAVLILGLSACQKKAQVNGVALSVSFSEKALSDNLITDVQYKWKTSADFKKFDTDYNVFVHFWHGSNMLLQDDYAPEVPTSQWEPGKEYLFTRRILIPQFIDEFDPQFKGEETLRMSVGFYSPYDREGKSKVEILENKLKVTPPPPDTPEIIYEDGWYDLEVNPEAFLNQWRWTAKEAKCLIDNPKRDALLVIKGGVNLDALTDQKVIFKINDTVLDEFIPTESNFEKSYNIKKEMLGDKDEFSLIIATDKSFVPAQSVSGSTDQRELGLQVSFIYFR